ncbi:MAG: ABC transporter permease subunit [Phycisphaeraceae bacterium]|nr:ABC transporter permease subunit [Phycisphaeraceae bacterium]
MSAALRWLLRLGPANPIVVRIVQGGSRRTRHMYLRTGYLAALIGVLLWLLLLKTGQGSLSYRDLAAAGATAFEWSAYLQIALICLLAPVFMAGAIAQEANPRTWEILLTTPLSASQVVLGNFLGRMFFIIALLLASLPLFAITQYFGGVPGSSIFSSYAIALCFALLVGAIAITLSVNRLAGQRAVFAFYIAIVSYIAVTGAIDLKLRVAGGGQVTFLTPLNPFLALNALLSPSSYATPSPAELAAMPWIKRLWFGSPTLSWCLISSLCSAAMLGVSAGAVRLIGTKERRTSRRLGLGGGQRDGHSPRTVWHNPIAWAEAVARGLTLKRWIARWTFIAAGALWGLWVIFAYHNGTFTHNDFRFTLGATLSAETLIVSLVAMNMAATAVTREREDGTLDLILATPVTPAMYLRGKLRGLIAYLVPMIAVPAGTIALAGIYTLAGGLGRAGGVTVSEPVGVSTMNLPVVLPISALTAPVVSVGFIAVVVMIGLQWSLKSKGAVKSVVWTVCVVGAVAGTIGLCGLSMLRSIAYVGPIVACFTPVTAVWTLVNPAAASATLESGGTQSLTMTLAIGAVVAGVVDAIIVYGFLSSMTRNFDMTVRKLAGQR